MNIKFGIRIPPFTTAVNIAEEASSAEKQGFKSLWFPDSPLVWRDIWVTMTHVAQNTSSAMIGTAVTNPIIRHPVATASAAVAISELSQERFVLGIGAGGSSVHLLGMKHATLARMRESTTMIRSLVSGELINIGDKHLRLKGAEERTKPIPIYYAVSGPKMLQLAGESADGVIFLAGIGNAQIEYAIENIKSGVQRANRSLDDIELIAGAYCHISSNYQESRRLMRPLAHLFISQFPDTIAQAGVPVPEVPKIENTYPDLHHAEDWEHAIELTNWIPDEILDLFCQEYCLLGSLDEITKKLERMVSKGIGHFFLLGISSYEMPTDIVNYFGEVIIPYFAA